MRGRPWVPSPGCSLPRPSTVPAARCLTPPRCWPTHRWSGRRCRPGGWSADALDELLGHTARTHLDRDELAPLRRRTAGGSALETLARLFVLGTGVELREARRAGVPESWLVPDGYDVAAAVRLQPVRHDGAEVLVAHDPGRAADGIPPSRSSASARRR